MLKNLAIIVLEHSQSVGSIATFFCMLVLYPYLIFILSWSVNSVVCVVSYVHLICPLPPISLSVLSLPSPVHCIVVPPMLTSST